jgi:hypothetical protein
VFFLPRRRCGLVALPRQAGAMSEVIHRTEIFAGLRRRFGGESFGNSIFEFRCRLALPGACRRRAGRVDRRSQICVRAIFRFDVLQLRVRRPTGGCHRSSFTKHRGSPALADILVQCPRTGAPVSTGLKTEWVLLKSLPCVAVPLRCPACGQMHKWKPDDAWIGSARQSSDASLLNASRAPLYAAKTPE